MNPKSQESKLWDSMNPELKASILRGLEQSKKGIGSPYEEVIKTYRNKIKR
jgi:hypothetical protein